VPRDVPLEAPDPDSREGLVGSFNAAVGRLGWAAMGLTGAPREGRGPGEILLHTALVHEEAVARLDQPVAGEVLDSGAPDDAAGMAAELDFDEVCRRYQRASAALAQALLAASPEEFSTEATHGQWVRACTRHLVAHAQELESAGS
jgi:hypothetical protein